MPYSPTSEISINVVLTNDLSGSLSQPYVVSIDHVSQGTLKVSNGGTGLNDVPPGALLIGTAEDSLSTLTGSDNDLILWSEASGGWTNKKIDIISSIDITADENNLFSIVDISDISDKKFNFSFNTHPPGLFFASPSSSEGQLSARVINASDLPQYFEGLFINSSTFSGTFYGEGQFNNLSGDGSNLTGLTSSQIQNFEDDVVSLFHRGPNSFQELSIETASIGIATVQELLYATGSFEGSFYGDGTNLENISPNSIDGLKEEVLTYFSGGFGIVIDENGIISAPSTINSYITDQNIEISQSGQDVYFNLNNSIEVNSITASNIIVDNINISNVDIINLSASNITADTLYGNLYGSLLGSYTGSGEAITNIPNESLQNSSIIINGNDVPLGSSISVAGISQISSQNENIIIINSGSDAILDFSNNPEFSQLYCENLQVDEINAGFIYGDGSNITNISFQNVGSANITNLTSSNLYSNDIQSISLLAVDVEATTLKGDGSQITNIDVNNIPLLSYLLERVFTGSANITVSTDPYMITRATLNSDISLTSVTASFSGDGSGLTNIQTPIVKKYSGVGLSVGNVVCLSNSTTVEKCNNSIKTKSIPIGIVNRVDGSEVTVQLAGDCHITNNLSNQIVGETIYVGVSGDAVRYSEVSINSYAVELGTIVDNNTALINIKNLWKIK